DVAQQNTVADAPAKPQLQPADVAPQNDPALQLNPAPSTSGAALRQAAQKAQKNHAPTPRPYAAWDKDGVKIIPFGILIANLNYNTSSLDPGSIVGFANPDIPTNNPEFDISPGNTFLGVDFKWPKIGEWEINGKVDFDL